jgi:hypothetical protein
MAQVCGLIVMIFFPLGQLARPWRIALDYLYAIEAVLADEACLAEFRDPPASRADLEASIANAEDVIAVLIGVRTRELLGLGFSITRRPKFDVRIARARSMDEVLARYSRVRASLTGIDRIARRRANRIRRERELTAVGLPSPAHAPVSSVLSVWSVVSRFAKHAAERIRAPP